MFFYPRSDKKIEQAETAHDPLVVTAAAAIQKELYSKLNINAKLYKKYLTDLRAGEENKNKLHALSKLFNSFRFPSYISHPTDEGAKLSKDDIRLLLQTMIKELQARDASKQPPWTFCSKDCIEDCIKCQTMPSSLFFDNGSELNSKLRKLLAEIFLAIKIGLIEVKEEDACEYVFLAISNSMNRASPSSLTYQPVCGAGHLSNLSYAIGRAMGLMEENDLSADNVMAQFKIAIYESYFKSDDVNKQILEEIQNYININYASYNNQEKIKQFNLYDKSVLDKFATLFNDIINQYMQDTIGGEFLHREKFIKYARSLKVETKLPLVLDSPNAPFNIQLNIESDSDMDLFRIYVENCITAAISHKQQLLSDKSDTFKISTI